MAYVEDLITVTKICANCKHFVSKGSIWYDQYCGAKEVRAKKAIDPVTGKIKYIKQNDFGNTYYDDNPRPYARDINNGDCPYYEV